MIKSLINNLFLLLILFFLIILFLNKLFFPKISIFITPDFGQSDLLHGYYPLKHLLSESIKKNEMLLWTKNLATGYPVFADGQIGTFTLTNLILYKFFPTFWAINLSYLVIFFTIGLGTYLFAQEMKLNRLLSLLAAIIFTFSGFNLMQITHISLLQAASWLPLELYFLEKFIEKKKLHWLLFLSLTFSQQILCGHQQITVYSLLTCSLYLFLRIFFMKTPLKKRLKKALFNFFFLLIAIVLSVGLSTILLIPSFELFQLSSRNQATSAFQFPFPPKHFLTFITPFMLGNPKEGSYPIFSETWGIFWENTGYVGLLPIILLPLVFFFLKKDPFLPPFLSLLFISFLLIPGQFSPIYFFFSIPPFSFFRVASRFLLLADFSLAILSALTLNQIIKRKVVKERVVNLALSFLILFHLVNIFYYFYHYHPVGDAKKWLKTPKSAQFLQKDKDARFYAFDTDIDEKWNEVFLSSGWLNAELYLPFQEGLIGNSSLFYDISKTNYFVSFLTKRMEIVNQILYSGFSLDKESKEIVISPYSKKVLNIQGVKYLLVAKEKTLSQYQPLAQLDKYTLYENPYYLRRARMVYEYRKVDTVEEMKRTFLSDDLDPEKEVILEKEISHSNILTFEHSKNKIEWVKDENQEIELKVYTENDGLLVLADTYYPGWKAFIDGKEREILAANLNQRAIQVGQGSHIVKFIYQPRSFKIGAVISGTTLLFTIFLLVFPFLSLILRKFVRIPGLFHCS